MDIRTPLFGRIRSDLPLLWRQGVTAFREPEALKMFSTVDDRAEVMCRRREFLRVGGGLAVTSLVLPDVVDASINAAGVRAPSAATFGRAKSCIFVYLLGGPPHLDIFDLKPDAPAEIRGPFRPIPTSVPGLQICEHLPRLARLATKYALVRSVSHRNSHHTPMIYYTLTGRRTAFPDRDNDIRPPQRTDFPHMGAVLAKFRRRGSRSALPGSDTLPGSVALADYVALPELGIRSSIGGEYKRARTPLRGGAAGFLGAGYDPLLVDGPPGTSAAIPALVLPESVSAERFEERSAILSLLDRGGPRVSATDQYGTIRRRAVMLTGAASRGKLQIFSLEGEPSALRDRYGRHRFGQTMLLARRLAGAGVPMIGIHFNEMTVCDGWDLHSKNHEALRDELLPMLDQSLSALLEDLDQRGRLDDTLVVCMGEFGRTPKINRNAGRDHWGECSSTLLAGGGIRGGQVHGSSDRNGAYPATDPVDPVDIQATIYHCLGLDSHQMMVDLSGREWPVTAGSAVMQLF